MFNNGFICGAVIFTFVLSGCGGDPGPQRVPVKGNIVMGDGKPVFPGSIQFFPAEGMSENTYRSSALLHEGGAFTMRTHPHGDGVVPGKYKVVLSLGMGSPRELAKYSSADTSTLEVTVPPEGLPDLQLKLEEKMGSTKKRGGPPGLRG